MKKELSTLNAQRSMLNFNPGKHGDRRSEKESGIQFFTV